MNKNLLIASAITAGAVALYYVLKRKRIASHPLQPGTAEHHPRHLTNVFAKAKQSIIDQ